MLSNEQAHSLVEHIQGERREREPVDAEAVRGLLRRPHHPNGLWAAIRDGLPVEWEQQPATLETMAALLFELAETCEGMPNGNHCFCNVAWNGHDACEWCGVNGDVVRSLNSWLALQPAMHD